MHLYIYWHTGFLKNHTQGQVSSPSVSSYIYKHIHTCIDVCTCQFTYIHIYTYSYMYWRMYMYIYIHSHIYTDIQGFLNTTHKAKFLHHQYLHIYTYIHTYIHTFTYLYVHLHTYSYLYWPTGFLKHHTQGQVSSPSVSSHKATSSYIHTNKLTYMYMSE
jgi:hypothetical protein